MADLTNQQLFDSLVAAMTDITRQIVSQEVQASERRLGRRMDKLDQRMDGLENRMDGLDQRIDGAGQRIDGLEQRLAGKIDRLERKIKEGQAINVQHFLRIHETIGQLNRRAADSTF